MQLRAVRSSRTADVQTCLRFLISELDSERGANGRPHTDNLD